MAAKAFFQRAKSSTDDETVPPPDYAELRDKDTEESVNLGRVQLDDGAEFIGEMINGQPHGLGTIVYAREPPDPEGRVEYAGMLKGGQRHGMGSMLWRDGTSFMGEWKRNRPTGFGFEAYPDGSYYQGTFDNDQRDGIGVYEFPNGLYYAGGWRQGKRYGAGIATDINKNKFVLTYDRTGKLMTKHQFSSMPAANSADASEREVVAEVLRVTLEVRKVAEKARGIASLDLRRRNNVPAEAFIAKKHQPAAGALHGGEVGHFAGTGNRKLARANPAAIMGPRTPAKVSEGITVHKSASLIAAEAHKVLG